MTEKEKRELKDGVISIFKRFNILDHAATIGGLRDDILRYINSLQEEPKKCMYSKDNYTDEDRKVLCGGWEEECEFKPVTSVWHDAKEEPQTDRQILLVMKNGNKKVFTHYGCSEYYIDCVWVKLSEQNKWAYIDDLLKL